MADFRAFLAPNQPVVLPYFGGTRVDSADRRFRIEGDLEMGWWQFEIEGRRAVAKQPASPPALDSLPRVRGHWVDGWIVVDGRQLVRVALPPDDEPASFSRVSARRWYSGDHVFDAVEFEDTPEVGARHALEAERSLAALADVVPSLRVAFGIALCLRRARAAGVAVSVPEVVPRAVSIADVGRPAADHWFTVLALQRKQAAEQVRLATAAGTARVVARSGDPVRRADEALEKADARMIACRSLDRGAQLEVTYEVDGTRIVSTVDAGTLQVFDPGLCLSGAHRVLTLDAMPSVVREAIADDALNITRWE